jgi:hypothetical protein
MGTRNKHQCKSHHQKMMKNYKSLDGIIKAIDLKLKNTIDINNN